MKMSASTPLTRLLFALSLVAFFGSTAYAEQAGTWWCYNENCCEYHGGIISQNCMFDCGGYSDGVHYGTPTTCEAP